jgi:CHASE1-domain containing sensor protein
MTLNNSTTNEEDIEFNAFLQRNDEDESTLQRSQSALLTQITLTAFRRYFNAAKAISELNGSQVLVKVGNIETSIRTPADLSTFQQAMLERRVHVQENPATRRRSTR